eukprot:TRINITY_DN5883_c0_g1_i1.p1 TRINITY_DN5883_c0_g1~~TRINITY_DN5883_c0_g1_i1.p1  ORF type:complete len:421 (+),score=14.91 TRINITY_DN5883_c0_g1_i1:232-1494(+)
MLRATHHLTTSLPYAHSFRVALKGLSKTGAPATTLFATRQYTTRSHEVVRYPPEVLRDVRRLAEKPQTPTTLDNLIRVGEKVVGGNDDVLLQSAQFLHNELPIRLAHRVKELDNLPHGLSFMPSVRKVRDWYLASFTELRASSRPRTLEDEKELTRKLNDIYNRHAPTLITLARGVYELTRELDNMCLSTNIFSDYDDIHEFLDKFYMSRIGIRMLIGQHLEFHKPQVDGWVGLICKHTSAHDVVLDAINDAAYACERAHGLAPEVTIHGRKDLTFSYVPSHLYYIMFELLKNSMRAVVEHHGDKGTLPPLKVIIADDESFEDVSIKVSDEGGGISRKMIPKAWSYLYTTATLFFENEQDQELADFHRDIPLAGFGYGLPISRLYAMYFGGNLDLMSMEGYGTDAYVHIHKLGTKMEPLP